MFSRYLERWNYPDDEDRQWFNEIGERATIKAIVDGTSVPRSWSDIQSTWPWCRMKKHLPKVKVEKKRTARAKPNWKLVRILESNGMEYKDAIQTALKLLGNRKV